MKLKKIVKYLDYSASVVIWQIDCYIDKEKPEKIFEGCVMDIPWVYMDYYLINDKVDKAVDCRLIEGNSPTSCLVISVAESKERANEGMS